MSGAFKGRYRVPSPRHRTRTIIRRTGIFPGRPSAISSAPIARMPRSCRWRRAKPRQARVCCACLPAKTSSRPATRPRPIAHFKGKDGTALKDPYRPALAHGRVRFVGEPVALVVAESADAAQDAAELIEIDYRDLPVVPSRRRRSQPGAPQLHDDVPGNLAFDYEYGNEPAADAAFAQAAHVTRLTLESTRVSGSPMEPKACLAAYDAASECVRRLRATQGMSDMPPKMARVPGLAREGFRHPRAGRRRRLRHPLERLSGVLRADVRGEGARPAGQMGRLARRDHRERPPRRAQASQRRARARSQGQFLGMRFDWIVDMGAYLVAGPAGSSTPTPLPTGMRGFNAYRTPPFTAPPSRAHQHARRPRLSRRRAPERRLSRRAAGGRGGARSPASTASSCAGAISFRRKRSRTRRRPARPTTAAIRRTLLENALQARRLEWLRAKRRSAIAAAASCAASARHLHRALGRRRTRKRSRSSSASRQRHAATRSRARPARATRPCSPEIVADVFGIGAGQDHAARSDPEGPPAGRHRHVRLALDHGHGGALSVATAHEVMQERPRPRREGARSRGGRHRVREGPLPREGHRSVDRLSASLRASMPAAKATRSTPWPRSTRRPPFRAARISPRSRSIPRPAWSTLLSYVAVDDCGRVVQPHHRRRPAPRRHHAGHRPGPGRARASTTRRAASSSPAPSWTTSCRAPTLLPAITLYDHPTPSPTNPLGVKGAGEAGTDGRHPDHRERRHRRARAARHLSARYALHAGKGLGRDRVGEDPQRVRICRRKTRTLTQTRLRVPSAPSRSPPRPAAASPACRSDRRRAAAARRSPR